MQNIFEKILSLFKRSRTEEFIRHNTVSDKSHKVVVSNGTIKEVFVFNYLGDYSVPTFGIQFNTDIVVNSESSSNRVYYVNLYNLTCTCKSYEHLKTLYSSRQPGILCKHLCKTLINHAQLLGLKLCEISCIELTIGKKAQEKYSLFSYNSQEFIVAFTKDKGWVNICKEAYWGYSPSEQRWAGAVKPQDAGIFQALAKYILQRTTIPTTFNLESESVKPSTSEIVYRKRQRWIKSISVVPGGVRINFESDTALTFLNCTTSIINSLENEILLNPNISLDIALATFLFKHQIRVKEIEEYYDRYRKKYEERLAEGQQSATAIKFLNIRPFKCCNREMSILNGYDKDRLIYLFTFKDSISFNKVKLVELLAGDEQFKFNLAFYVSRGPNSIHKSNTSDHYRTRFLSLVKTGIVKHGRAIDSKDLLKTLAIKDIRNILSGSGLKCNTKEEGITHIIGLDNYEVKVKPYLSQIDDYFKLMPFPFEVPNDLRSVVERDLEYYNSIAITTINLTDNIF